MSIAGLTMVATARRHVPSCAPYRADADVCFNKAVTAAATAWG